MIRKTTRLKGTIAANIPTTPREKEYERKKKERASNTTTAPLVAQRISPASAQKVPKRLGS